MTRPCAGATTVWTVVAPSRPLAVGSRRAGALALGLSLLLTGPVAAQQPPSTDAPADSAQATSPALVFDSTSRPTPLDRAQGRTTPPIQDEPVDADGDGVPALVDFCPDSPPGSRVAANGCPPEPLPWWVWAGGTAGFALLSWIGWVPYARWKRRKRLREALLENPIPPRGAFAPPGAPVPWTPPVDPSAAPGAPPPGAVPPGAVPNAPAPPPAPWGQQPAAPATPPQHPGAATPGPSLEIPPPQPGGWRVGFPAPYDPRLQGAQPQPGDARATPPQGPPPGAQPSHAGFPEPEPAPPTGASAAPVPVPATVGDDRLFQTNPANRAGHHHWQGQPLHFEQEKDHAAPSWWKKNPAIVAGGVMVLLVATVALYAQSRTPQRGPVPGVRPVTAPTVVSLAPADPADSATGPTQIPAALRMVDGDEQLGRVGQTLPTPVAVQVEDENGQPIPGVAVMFEATVGGGRVSPIATQTDSAGIARSFWTLGPQVVTQYVVARVAGSEAGVAFEADAAPGIASRIVVMRGDSQSAPPGQMLTEPVVIRVEGQAGQALEGVQISFSPDAGTVNPVEATSDTAGLVSTVWTLGPTGDTATLLAEIADAPGITTSAFARLSYPSLPAQPGVVAGGSHTCALSAGGALECWGDNQSGQLGRAGGSEPTPLPVAPGRTFAEVSAGLSYTCGVESSGQVYCWGDNANAQLGDGSRIPQALPSPVAADVRFRSVAAGSGHTCGLSREGSIYCWGSNSYGQIGDGSRSDRDRPVRSLAGGTFQAVAVGWFHTCGLSPDGRAACWGRNAFGQLGNGTTNDQADPRPVGGAARYRTLAAGGAHTCGLATDRAIYCWGQNNYGQLGDGGNQPRTRPVPVSGGAWRAVTTGGVHTCGLDASGAAFCWGRNTYGQLGDGSTSDRATPTAVAGGLVFATIRASGAHTCGTTASGQQYCWGSNVEGQLGDGSTENRSTPTRVVGSD